jgi:DNA modification methylase
MVHIEVWDDTSSNQQQQYLTHGLFRYFGKLPPTVTGKILDEVGIGNGSNILDVMCGSGTTLIEAGVRGSRATGIDCNEISTLVSRVKTQKVDIGKAKKLLTDFEKVFSSVLAEQYIDQQGGLPGETHLPVPKSVVPNIRNIDHWFVPTSVRMLQRLRDWVDGRKLGPEQDLAMAAFVSSIRACSRASVRTGRLFFDVDKRIPNPAVEFLKRLNKMISSIEELATDPRWQADRVKIFSGDARNTDLEANSFDLVFCHPPYFALYRYSSDILRFEMEWAGKDRKTASKREIVDGFKTTNEKLVLDYVRDLVDVSKEALRVSKIGGHLVFVTADSTLRKQQLEVLEPLIAGVEAAGWTLVRRAIRQVRFAQASYHRSADSEITRPEDQVVIFRRLS